ncbi:hypothetical protein RND71_006845 [Anisodus tanguticus]|uniref:FRIGIDA-like protein n=1 Tax=Anisodus tanguticus TaxID=243964 RepID=A0AAE1SRK1_9SOLA|nr:hypothetical protein RND71_006845 [Anisodus tanguticus]
MQVGPNSFQRAKPLPASPPPTSLQGVSAMEDTQSVATLMDSTTSKIQQLQKAFAELESHRAVTLNLQWKQLEEHFHGLQKSLKRRFTELEEQEKEFETKIVQSTEMLEKRQAAVIAKEQASLQRLQEKRDAAVSAIAIALEKHKKPCSVEPSVVNCEVNDGPSILEDKPEDSIETEHVIEDTGKPFQDGGVEVKSFPNLVNLCRNMDSEGLQKFISDNRKNLAALREEIPLALRSAINPASLVLDSLNGFYNSDVSISDAKKDSNLLGLRRTCIMLLECLSTLLNTLEMDSISSIISENVKGRAKAIAEEWNPKLDELDVDANNGNSLEAHAFLQLLATFGINSNFNQENLSKLIPMVSRRAKQPISVVPLDYLTECQNDVNEKELSALKAVLKCIEDHKLEEQYPVDPLQKRVLQLEKAKADKKKATEVVKPQSKRPRPNGVGNGPRVVTEKNFYPRMTDRYPQPIYDRPYAYPGPTSTHVPSFMGAPAYNFSPGHDFFENGYHYQAPYLH